jgi:hypothetical protein
MAHLSRFLRIFGRCFRSLAFPGATGGDCSFHCARAEGNSAQGWKQQILSENDRQKGKGNGNSKEERLKQIPSRE